MKRNIDMSNWKYIIEEGILDCMLGAWQKMWESCELAIPPHRKCYITGNHVSFEKNLIFENVEDMNTRTVLAMCMILFLMKMPIVMLSSNFMNFYLRERLNYDVAAGSKVRGWKEKYKHPWCCDWRSITCLPLLFPSISSPLFILLFLMSSFLSSFLALWLSYHSDWDGKHVCKDGCYSLAECA